MRKKRLFDDIPIMNDDALKNSMLPLDNFHNSLDEKTPVARIVSLQTTPLYGL